MSPGQRQQALQVHKVVPRQERVLTPAAVEFLVRLHDEFEPRRQRLLEERARRQEQVRHGQRLGFRPDTIHIRESQWQVAPIPESLQDRRVEITGPVDRKMMINALNSGANVYMADFEDSHSPRWEATVAGQVNLQDAAWGRLSHDERGRHYSVKPDPALLVVRVRGLHLPEDHVRIDGKPVSGALFDFAMSFFHNARAMATTKRGPFYYLPKLEHYEEAQWWADVLAAAEKAIGVAHGTTKVTVLIETLPAAFQMDEILWALRDHITALNAGRWDYIFSCIKTLGHDAEHILPDRKDVTMDVPFMKAYTQLLVRTCHRRGAYAIGGMSAFIPSRDTEQNERAFEAVRADKRREAEGGFDGTWVAHPGLVDVARGPFDDVLGPYPNQLEVVPDPVPAERLLDFSVPGGNVTMEGLRNNVQVAIEYMDAWLTGRGAVAIHGLMEDAATAEISRSQVWQWVRHGVEVDGAPLTGDHVRSLVQETQRGLSQRSDAATAARAAELFLEATLRGELPAFLTILAYPHLERRQ